MISGFVSCGKNEEETEGQTEAPTDRGQSSPPVCGEYAIDEKPRVIPPDGGTGTISDTYKENILILTLSVTVHALGEVDSETGSGYVYIDGDTMYSHRASGATLVLTGYDAAE